MHRHDSANTTARHPLCPYCHYDLIASVDPVAPRFVRCPECGEDIEPHELAFQRRPGEWTELTGLRNAMLSILVRMLIVALVWAGLLWIMDSGLQAILGSTGILFHRVMLIPMGICAMILGWIMQWKLDEHAGFHSWLVIWLSIFATFMALHLGHGAANAVFSFAFLGAAGWSTMVGAGAMIIIVYFGWQQA